MKKFFYSILTGLLYAVVVNALVSTDEARKKVIEIYKNEFKLDIPEPVIEVYSATEQQGLGFQYFSNAWIGKSLYIIRLRSNGSYTKDMKPTKYFFPCIPKGELKTAVISIDFHNSNLSSVYPNQVIQYCNQINAIHQTYARNLGIDKPIIQYKMEYFLADSASYQTRKELDIWVKTFLTTKGAVYENYDLIVLLKFSQNAGGLCCWGDKSQILMQGNQFAPTTILDWTSGEGNYEMKYMIRSAFIHEGGHFHGWDHDWPSDLNNDLITKPSLFGWTDVDGDGVVEILDTTPYGMVNTAIAVHEDQTSVVLFPNPSYSGTFKLNKSAQSISVRNALGSLILITRNSDLVDLSGFSKGIYFAEIKTGNQMMVKKLVVQ